MVKRSRLVAFLLIVVFIFSAMGVTSKGIVKDVKLGLDLQGGFEVLYDVKPAKEGQKIDKNALTATVEALLNRVDVLGVSEPYIQTEGENRIRVQLAGVKDQNEAREILATEANLTFRDVNDNLLMDGSDLVEGGANQSFDEMGRPNVVLKLQDANKFGSVTEKIVKMPPGENLLVIWMDFEEGVDSFRESGSDSEKVVSAAKVDQVFHQDSVSIVGNFSVEEATTLANLLNAGALPVKLDEVYSTSVGAQFGEEALDKTVLAGIIAIIAIFIFLIAYYRLPGLIASIALTIYLYLTLLIFNLMNGVLTLPGIAAVILGVGMAVDANVITAERIREELKVGRPLQAAFKTGTSNSLTSIIDANLTTLLAAAVLFFYGTSSVKGFATLLIVSILVSFITAVYGSRWLLGLLVKSNVFKKPGWYGVKQKDIRDIRENLDTVDLPTRFDRLDFVKHRRKFFTLSGIFLAVGLVSLFVFKLDLGIDFSSGTRIELQAKQSITAEEYQDHLAGIGIETNDIVISGEEKNIGVARIKGEALTQEEVAALKAHFSDKFGIEPNVSTVSPTVGKELAKNAMIAILLASLGIILYVTVRFEMRMAVPAVIALLHDAFFMIAIFSITQFEVDLTFIAAVLTIIGYSINDTIVTFDRIRENMRKRKRIKTKEEIAEIVNRSLRQTLGRSINTAFTTLLAVAAILIFGSEAIFNFSFALFIGLIAGVYSSLFIAAQMYYMWKSKELKQKGVLTTFKEKKKYSDQPQV